MSMLDAEQSKPSTSVREIETADGAVLLDIRQGLCLSMTPISMRVWRLLKLNYSVDQITDKLSTEFQDVGRQQIRNDVVEFVADLVQKELLLASEPIKKNRLAEMLLFFFQAHSLSARHRVSPARMPRCLMLKAVLALLAFDVLRFGNNFHRIYSFVKAWPLAQKSAPHDAIERVCTAVNYACVLYPKRALCLQRSFVTTCLARSCGVAAKMIMGAQKVPFKAHAWTEVDGCPINERRNVHKLYLVWERI